MKRLRCISLCVRQPTGGPNGPQEPIAAFIDRSHIEALRKLSVGFLNTSDRPIERLHLKKLKKVTPTEPLHDPYIVALLIGFAQQKRDYLRSIGSNLEARMGMIPVC